MTRSYGWRKLIPEFLKPILRIPINLSLDLIDTLLGNKDHMTPPRSMSFSVGGRNFKKAGEEFKGYFIELGGLQPDDKVLDVGCGVGRMAIPLTDYLSSDGEYRGFDIVKKGIEWSQDRISTQFNNFNFTHSNVYNKHYNRLGNVQAKDYQFPYDDGFFDFIFLTSVFTHMRPLDIDNYLGETSRVLKTGGRCLITFFVLNDEAKKLVHLDRSSIDFSHKMESFVTTSKNCHERAIAYSEESVEKLFEKHGLTIRQPIHYGSWCDRKISLSYQDIVVAEKNKQKPDYP